MRAAAARAVALLALVATGAAADEGAVARGAYLARAGGCHACHTDHAGGGAPLAGGGKVETPFGTLFAPNITPDRDHGIGRWSRAQFFAAMRRGRATTGVRYYPAFPYTAYSGLTDADLDDLWTWLRDRPPALVADRAHEISFPFNQRIAALGWQMLFFRRRPFVADPAESETWNRGRYLAEHLLHCKECHTPRNLLGGPVESLAYAGNRDWPGDATVPNITPDKDTGIGGWGAGDIVWLLQTGFTPDGDDIQGRMAELVEHGSRHLSDADLGAVAEFIHSLDAIAYRVRKPKPAAASGGDDYDYDFGDDP